MPKKHLFFIFYSNKINKSFFLVGTDILASFNYANAW